MNLYSILACPICQSDVELNGEQIHCTSCKKVYPIINNVPVMLPDWESTNIQHEGELLVRKGYDDWIHRTIMQSFTDNQVVLDAGCGNMALDDPCIIRMDVQLTPYVDVVGDLHNLPFKPNSIDFVCALAVVEHLRQPFVAAEEIWRVLKPGGYVYAECNFVFAYHGYPHHYFNASIHGMQQVFSRFKELRLGVAPYQMPSFAVENILTNYLYLFKAENSYEESFVKAVHKVLKYPLRQYDSKFNQDTAFRVAAGEYFLGLKQVNNTDTIIPEVVIKKYLNNELKIKYTDYLDLTNSENLLIWAKNQGKELHPEIKEYLAKIEPFNKYGNKSQGFERSLPKAISTSLKSVQNNTSIEKKWSIRIFKTLKYQGVRGFAKKAVNYLKKKSGLM